MKFCFDLDETLVKGDVITQASRILLVEGKCDKIYTNRDVTTWDLAGIPKAVKEKTLELFNDPIYAVHKKKLIPGVQIFVNFVKSCGHEVYILTARPESCWEDTIKFIGKTFGDDVFKSVNCVNGGFASKLPALAKINPDYYFDDNIGFCEESRKLGINTYLISNEYTRWNHKLVHEDIKRLKNICFFPFDRI